MNSTTPTATERLAGLLRQQEQERADVVAELLDEERREAARIVGDPRPDAGSRHGSEAGVIPAVSGPHGAVEGGVEVD